MDKRESKECLNFDYKSLATKPGDRTISELDFSTQLL